jgi:nucleoside-diphosphate-sugar epimerase
MRILVAGATGVIGSQVVRALVAGGHDVFGTTRRPERVSGLNAAGATAIVMNALDHERVQRAVDQSAPDAVVHELTDLAGFDFAGNARLRIDGTANLVAACERAGVRRMVAQSISWAYQPGPEPAPEDTAFATDPVTGLPLFAAVEALERAVLALPEGVVLRHGLLYGPGTWYAADGPVAADARDGVVVATTAATSFVHVDDAVRATIAALGWPPGVVNVVDDDPTHVNEWGPLYIEATGGKFVRIESRAEGRTAANGRARELGWRPAHPSWRTSLLSVS